MDSKNVYVTVHGVLTGNVILAFSGFKFQIVEGEISSKVEVIFNHLFQFVFFHVCSPAVLRLIP